MWNYFHWQQKQKGFIQMLLCVVYLCEDYFHWHQQEHQGFINPFTSPACKVSGLKSAHIHSSKQYIWWSYNKPTLNTVHFDKNPFLCSNDGDRNFYWSFTDWRRGKHGSERVKMLLCATEDMWRLSEAGLLASQHPPSRKGDQSSEDVICLP